MTATAIAASRPQLGRARRWVIKIGSALLTDDGRGLDGSAISSWVEQMAGLHARGTELVLVSSGAVAEGIKRLGWKTRPHALHDLQAAAAVGQMGLIEAYETRFQRFGLRTGQILLTHEDLTDRKRYLNARSTLRTLLKLGVVPIINENDSVATEEIRLGDNDTLAALVTNLVEAELLVILTDQQGLFDRDPRVHKDATLIREGRAGDAALDAMAGGSAGALGRGGMLTKLRAAARAARSGAATLIVSGRLPCVLECIARGDDIGTLLLPGQETLAARKQWLASQLQLRGALVLDDGAVGVLRKSGGSLLPVGVTDVQGDFKRGEMVACMDSSGHTIAHGLVNYSASEARRIMRQPSDRIEALLGYVDEPELIHRDNLVLI